MRYVYGQKMDGESKESASQLFLHFSPSASSTYFNTMSHKNWDIRPPSKNCSVTEKEFEDGDTVFSTLEKKRSEFIRKDFSSEGWNQNPSENAKTISTWKSEFKSAPPPPPEPVRHDDAESLLRDLLQQESPSINAVYILAVMLERKRILKPVQTLRESGHPVIVYQHAKSGETFHITDPELKLHELASVQEEVMALLGGSAPSHNPNPESAPTSTETVNQEPVAEEPATEVSTPDSTETTSESPLPTESAEEIEIKTTEV